MATYGNFNVKAATDSEFKMVEAYHDGYLEDMLHDILAMPERASKMTRLGLVGGCSLLYYEFNPDYHDLWDSDRDLKGIRSFIRPLSLNLFIDWCNRLTQHPLCDAYTVALFLEDLQLTENRKYVWADGRDNEEPSFTVELHSNGYVHVTTEHLHADAKLDFQIALRAALARVRSTKLAQTYQTKVHPRGHAFAFNPLYQSLELYWYDYVRPLLNPGYTPYK